MSFKENLGRLRAEELRGESRKRALLGAEKERKIEKKRAVEEEVKKLERLSAQILRPYLESVNEVYLEGRGHIGSDKSGVKRTNKWNPDCYFELILSWDHTKRTSFEHEHKQLCLALGNNRVVKIEGGFNSPEILVNIDDKNAKQEIESSIYKILTTPGACVKVVFIDQPDGGWR